MSYPDRTTLLERARQIAKQAAARGQEADRLRKLPDATINELIEAQLFSIAAPRSQNGLECDLDVLLEVAKALGQGCGSTAWVLSLLGTHNWMGCLFPARTQQELFASRGYVLAPATFAPTGRLVPVEGGYRLSGRWGFGSGSEHASWAMLSALEEDDQGQVIGLQCVVLPMSEVQLQDNWRTSGMRGTGSQDMLIEDAFIPSHHAVPFLDMLEGRTAAGLASANPMHRIPLIPFLAYTAAAPALGMGQGAVNAFSEYLQQRVNLIGEKQHEKPAGLMRLGEASMKVRAAEALLDRGVADLLSKARAGHVFSVEERVHYRAEACYVATLVKEAIDLLAEGAGARAQFEQHPLQRFQRDINTLRGHVVFDLDGTMELAGRAMTGLPPNQPLI